MPLCAGCLRYDQRAFACQIVLASGQTVFHLEGPNSIGSWRMEGAGDSETVIVIIRLAIHGDDKVPLLSVLLFPLRFDVHTFDFEQ